MGTEPLMARLLKSRISYRHADARGGKSTKRIEEMVCSSFFIAQSLHFRGDIHDWRKLLAICQRDCAILPIENLTLLYGLKKPADALSIAAAAESCSQRPKVRSRGTRHCQAQER